MLLLPCCRYADADAISVIYFAYAACFRLRRHYYVFFAILMLSIYAAYFFANIMSPHNMVAVFALSIIFLRFLRAID